jgi:lipoyl(octanoyl) transferase|tara:strand:- start:8554 stop:9177 length:624 start_codon:yes stop_codon:yes gene_type:complete
MPITIKHLGCTDYLSTLENMKYFIGQSPINDELWITEHQPIFTTGVNKKNCKIPDNNIPHLFVDRGGKITYHGPGQLIIYTLINIKKQNLKIRQLVSILEDSIIEFLKKYKISSYSKIDAPGVFIDEKKICSIGLRIKKNYAYHGLSFNVDMDTKPFTMIDPCGFTDLKMAQLSDYNIKSTVEKSGKEIASIINKKLNLHYEQNNKY